MYTEYILSKNRQIVTYLCTLYIRISFNAFLINPESSVFRISHDFAEWKKDAPNISLQISLKKL